MVSIDTLMRQAPKTVHLYLIEAIENIDDCFGKGYAKANPQLVAAFISACAVDFQTMIQISANDLDY